MAEGDSSGDASDDRVTAGDGSVAAPGEGDAPPDAEAKADGGAGAPPDGEAPADGEQPPEGDTEAVDDEDEDRPRLGTRLARLWTVPVDWLSQSRLTARFFGDYDLRWREAKRYWRDEAAGFRPPARVCPRDGSHVVARRDLVSKTTWSGRVATRVVYRFETSNCAVCGARLIGECSRCRAPILAPVSPRCEACGLPQPWSPERLSSTQRMRPRRWGSDAADPAKLLYSRHGRKLLLLEGDITNMDIDAIVSNDDVDGRMYTLIASAIRERAGQAVEDESMSRGPYPLSHAWFTDSGAITSIKRGVVHVAAMNRRGDTDLETIRACVRSALREACEQHVESLAIAAFGTGPVVQHRKVITVEEWLEAIGTVIVNWFREPDPEVTVPQSFAIVIVLYEPEDFGKLERRLHKAVRKALEQPIATAGGKAQQGIP